MVQFTHTSYLGLSLLVFCVSIFPSPKNILLGMKHHANSFNFYTYSSVLESFWSVGTSPEEVLLNSSGNSKGNADKTFTWKYMSSFCLQDTYFTWIIKKSSGSALSSLPYRISDGWMFLNYFSTFSIFWDSFWYFSIVAPIGPTLPPTPPYLHLYAKILSKITFQKLLS